MPAVQTVAFTGTSTGNKYTVGRSYTMGGQAYRANADGSFTKESTGRTLVGSSRDPDVTFYERPLGNSGGVNRSPSNGPGSNGALSDNGRGVSPGTGPGNPAVVQNGAKWGGWLAAKSILLGGGEPADTTQIVIGGKAVIHDRGFSDAGEFEQRFGESEFLSPGWFYGWGVTGADAAKSFGVRTDKIGNFLWEAPGKLLDGAVDFAGYLDQRKIQIQQEKSRRPGGFNGQATTFVTGGGF